MAAHRSPKALVRVQIFHPLPNKNLTFYKNYCIICLQSEGKHNKPDGAVVSKLAVTCRATFSALCEGSSVGRAGKTLIFTRIEKYGICKYKQEKSYGIVNPRVVGSSPTLRTVARHLLMAQPLTRIFESFNYHRRASDMWPSGKGYKKKRSKTLILYAALVQLVRAAVLYTACPGFKS